jgi:putative membrane protein
MGPISLFKSLLSGPGPRTIPEGLILFSKGICMGCADIIPGVSGGTMALIMGIYSQLLLAVSSINDAIKHAVKLDFAAAAASLHLRFLICLLSGIGISIVGLAGLMHYLLAEQPVPTWALFFGLISGSILIIGRKITNWPGVGGIAFVAGSIGAFFLVGIIPISTPETYSFIFFAGMIAICAMILPGISGSFLLLIMGKYQFITGAIKNPFAGDSFAILAVFGCGCLCGLLGFSKILSYLLSRYHNATMALLTGLMLGSLRKIWPWKETIESIVIRGKTHILSTKNIIPPIIDGEFYLALTFTLIGLAFVLVLQKMTGGKLGE